MKSYIKSYIKLLFLTLLMLKVVHFVVECKHTSFKDCVITDCNVENTANDILDVDELELAHSYVKTNKLLTVKKVGVLNCKKPQLIKNQYLEYETPPPEQV